MGDLDSTVSRDKAAERLAAAHIDGTHFTIGAWGPDSARGTLDRLARIPGVHFIDDNRPHVTVAPSADINTREIQQLLADLGPLASSVSLVSKNDVAATELATILDQPLSPDGSDDFIIRLTAAKPPSTIPAAALIPLIVAATRRIDAYSKDGG